MVEVGWNQLVVVRTANKRVTCIGLARLLSRPKTPYGDGYAAEKIIDALGFY